MRVLIVRKPTVSSIDGVRMDLFQVDQEYELGTSLAAVMLAEGWATPVALDELAVVASVGEPDRSIDTRRPTGPANLAPTPVPLAFDAADVPGDPEGRKPGR